MMFDFIIYDQQNAPAVTRRRADCMRCLTGRSKHSTDSIACSMLQMAYNLNNSCWTAHRAMEGKVRHVCRCVVDVARSI